MGNRPSLNAKLTKLKEITDDLLKKHRSDLDETLLKDLIASQRQLELVVMPVKRALKGLKKEIKRHKYVPNLLGSYGILRAAESRYGIVLEIESFVGGTLYIGPDYQTGFIMAESVGHNSRQFRKQLRAFTVPEIMEAARDYAALLSR